ncbi:VanW family protein [Oscillibacter sp.]|uniref:VanW family protein n=1 Tax=Oscillibacter sp. TaxID=1945593 RepID=UPI003390265A
MVDPNNRQLRPPIHRIWLRLRLGKLYYGGRRRLLWMSPRFHWAKQRQTERLPYMLISHATPLYRHLRGEDQELQENKVANLRLAVARLDGIVLYPGETFSYWRLIGKPTRRKGYRDGMVLFLGRIGSDVGGGLCQLSNLIFWMTLHTPLTVVERYRHSRCLSGYQPDPALRQRRHLRLSPPGSDDPQRHGTALPALCPGGKAGSEGRVAGPGTSGLPL